jgi:uncharacterized protein YuzE
MVKTIDYDGEHDMLYVHNGYESGEKFSTNQILGDLVLDISTKGRVVGLEIMNASSYLRDFNVDRPMLQNLTDVAMQAQSKDGCITIGLVFRSRMAEVPAKIAVQC